MKQRFGITKQLYHLALCYRSGEGVDYNLKKAAIWFSKAADSLSPGTFQTSVCMNGDGSRHSCCAFHQHRISVFITANWRTLMLLQLLLARGIGKRALPPSMARWQNGLRALPLLPIHKKERIYANGPTRWTRYSPSLMD